MSCAPFHVADIFDDVDDMAWYTSTLISDIVNHHAPIKSKLIKSKPVPYMNSRLRKALYIRNMARNKFKKFGKKYWEENRRQRNRVVSIRKQSMKNYFEKKCEKPDRNLWATISPFLSDKKFKGNNTITLKEDNETITDQNKVAEIFNKYFVSVAAEIGFPDPITSSDEALLTHQNHPSVIKIREKHPELHNSFSFHAVNPQEIMIYMKQFNIKKATGYDNIPGKIIRLAHRELSVPFANLINISLSQSVFPDAMKCAEVSPILKKDDNLRKGNFRPVSILTSLSKIYETVLNNQLLRYFYAIFNDLLSAFRKGYSCQSLLLKFVEDMKNALDQKHTVGALFMDLSKAFDCLPHGLLVAKLHAYGLTPTACRLLGDYLSGRRQRVKISNARSSWETLAKGVPQGSILGPLLFNIFINDMFYFIEKCSLYNYAADNSLSISAPTADEVLLNLKHDCEISLRWYKQNGMEANPNKFQFLISSPHTAENMELKLKIDENITLAPEPFVKLLGIYIDSRLTFTDHVSSCCNKAARQLNALSRISKYLDLNCRKLIFRSLVLSNFTYCPIVWHFCGKQNNSKVEKIQERALRILYDDYDSEYTELLAESRTTTMLHSRFKCIILEVFKSMQGINPACIQNMFEIKKSSYSLRDSSIMVQPKRNSTTFGLRSFSYFGSKLWNDLPNHFKGTTDFITFKDQLQHWSGPNLSGLVNFHV